MSCRLCDLPVASPKYQLCGRHFSRLIKYGDALVELKSRATVHETAKPKNPKRFEMYGLDEETVRVIWDMQGGKCAICRRELQWSGKSCFNVDHDHDTGEPRGLLCRPCNRGLGLLGDSVKLLNQAAVYLTGGDLLERVIQAREHMRL